MFSPGGPAVPAARLARRPRRVPAPWGAPRLLAVAAGVVATVATYSARRLTSRPPRCSPRSARPAGRCSGSPGPSRRWSVAGVVGPGSRSRCGTAPIRRGCARSRWDSPAAPGVDQGASVPAVTIAGLVVLLSHRQVVPAMRDRAHRRGRVCGGRRALGCRPGLGAVRPSTTARSRSAGHRPWSGRQDPRTLVERDLPVVVALLLTLVLLLVSRVDTWRITLPFTAPMRAPRSQGSALWTARRRAPRVGAGAVARARRRT